ncbi:MAG: hypothetical protein ACI810_003011, partial [Gammaproteobacteria bacterium]
MIGVHSIKKPGSYWPTGLFIEPFKNQKLAYNSHRHSLWLNTQV